MEYQGNERFRPLSMWNYFWLQILFAVPVVGMVFLIIYAISPANINRRNFARSYFCVYIIVIVLVTILASMGVISNIFVRG